MNSLSSSCRSHSVFLVPTPMRVTAHIEKVYSQRNGEATEPCGKPNGPSTSPFLTGQRSSRLISEVPRTTNNQTARVDGRVAVIPIARGRNISAGAVLATTAKYSPSTRRRWPARSSPRRSSQASPTLAQKTFGLIGSASRSSTAMLRMHASEAIDAPPSSRRRLRPSAPAIRGHFVLDVL
jgi:hypothetical protein